MRRFLTMALIASVLLTTNAFSADAKKSTHAKHHAKGAAHSQHHAQHVQHVAPTHPSGNHKKGQAAHKPAHQQV